MIDFSSSAFDSVEIGEASQTSLVSFELLSSPTFESDFETDSSSFSASAFDSDFESVTFVSLF